MKNTTANKAPRMPLLPMDLSCRRETGASRPLQQFIRERWRTTTALLRRELRRKSVDSAFGAA